jgi:hypothetical protein
MRAMIQNREFRNGHWGDVVRFVTENGGVEVSAERSAALARDAEAELEHVNDGAARAALSDAVRYAVTRRR